MTLLIVLLTLVGAVWGLYFALRGSLLLAAMGYLTLAAVFGSHFAHFDIAGITLSIDRIALVALLAGLVLQWKLRPELSLRWSTAEYVLLLFYGILILNVFAHDWRSRLPDQVPILPHLIEGYLIPLVLYFIGRRSATNERELSGWYLMLGVFGIYLAWTSLCEVTGAWGLVFPKYIADPRLGIHFGRARGPFLQSVRLGIFLIAALAAVWIPLVWRKIWSQRGFVLGLLLSLFQVIATTLTFTRSIWMGLVAGSALIAALTFTPRWRRFCLYGLIVMSLIAIPLKDHLLTMKREYGTQETLESTKMRAVFAYVSWLMFQDRPLTGFGFGHFPHEKDAYLGDRSTELRLESIRGYIHHNTYLSLLVELGLVGLLLYLMLLGTWGVNAIRLWQTTTAPTWCRGQALMTLILLATCVIQMLFHEVSYSMFENGLLYLTAGVGAGLHARYAPGRSVGQRGSMEPWLDRRLARPA